MKNTSLFGSVAKLVVAALLATPLSPVSAVAADPANVRHGVYVPAVMRTVPDMVQAAHDHPGGWAGRGWGGWHGRGWGGGGWYGRDDGGDVLAGLLVLGGIAAIAVAASNADRHNREQARDYPDRPSNPRYGDDRSGNGRGSEAAATGPGSIDAAVDTCVDEVESAAERVDTVDSVNNTGDGWHVEGHLHDGKPFACRVSGDGHIRTLTVDGHAPAG